MPKEIRYQPTFEDRDYYWSTYDLSLCSCLITLQFPILHFDREQPKKVRFVFKRSEELEKTVEDYFSDRLSFNPRTLFDNQKLVKNMLYSDI